MTALLERPVPIRCTKCSTMLGIWDGASVDVEYAVRRRDNRVHLRCPGGEVTIRCPRCSVENTFHTDSLTGT